MVFDPSIKKTTALASKYNEMAEDEMRRFRELVCAACEISETTFYEWLKKPAQIGKMDRWYIARLLKIEPRELFKPDQP